MDTSIPRSEHLPIAAPKIARRGKPVFPCKPDKSPYTPRGFKDATTNLGLVTAFWTKYPDALIGMPTGRQSGVAVMDVDRLEALEELEPELVEELRETLTVHTPSGGLHFYFDHVEGITNRTGALPDGIDIRGEGGYVIVPPSPGYRVEKRAPIRPGPEGLLEKLREKPATPLRAVAGDVPKVDLDCVGPIPEGGRNNTLTAIGGKLRAYGFEHDEIEATLLKANAERCTPPLEPIEVCRIAASVSRYEPGKGGPPPDAATVEVLDKIEAAFWDSPWPKTGGKSERSLTAILIKLARRHSRLLPGGDIEVSVSHRALALAVATQRKSVQRAIERSRWLRQGKSGSGSKSGTVILVAHAAVSVPRAKVPHSNHGESIEREKSVCGVPLRAPFIAPRLRWSAPGNLRLGKSCEAVIDYLEQLGDSASLEELADLMHVSRLRDFRRRVIDRLQERGVVECSENRVLLVGDWLEVLNREREKSGEIAAYRRDLERFNRQREGYANRNKNKPDHHTANHQRDGWIADLDPVDPAPAESPPEPEVSELARVIREYLDRRPHDVDQPPGWLGTTLWAYDLRPDKATASEVQAAIEELGGERYRRERICYAEQAV
jgi:hypothetical protein